MIQRATFSTAEWAKLRGISRAPVAPRVAMYHHSFPRKADAVARRAVVLRAICAVRDGRNAKSTFTWLKKINLDGELTPFEQRFLKKSTSLSPAEKVELTSAHESLYVLLWALEFVEALNLPNFRWNLTDLKLPFPEVGKSADKFIAEARLLTAGDLIAEVNRHNALFDSIVELQSLSTPLLPHDLCFEVLVSRQCAFEWLCVPGTWDKSPRNTFYTPNLHEAIERGTPNGQWFKTGENPLKKIESSEAHITCVSYEQFAANFHALNSGHKCARTGDGIPLYVGDSDPGPLTPEKVVCEVTTDRSPKTGRGLPNYSVKSSPRFGSNS